MGKKNFWSESEKRKIDINEMISIVKLLARKWRESIGSLLEVRNTNAWHEGFQRFRLATWQDYSTISQLLRIVRETWSQTILPLFLLLTGTWFGIKMSICTHHSLTSTAIVHTPPWNLFFTSVEFSSSEFLEILQSEIFKLSKYLNVSSFLFSSFTRLDVLDS